jgi:hypothetical protein
MVIHTAWLVSLLYRFYSLSTHTVIAPPSSICSDDTEHRRQLLGQAVLCRAPGGHIQLKRRVGGVHPQVPHCVSSRFSLFGLFSHVSSREVLGYGDRPDDVWFESPADSRLNGLPSFDFNSLGNPVEDVPEDSEDTILQSEGLELPFGAGALLDEEPEVS